MAMALKVLRLRLVMLSEQQQILMAITSLTRHVSALQLTLCLVSMHYFLVPCENLEEFKSLAFQSGAVLTF